MNDNNNNIPDDERRESRSPGEILRKARENRKLSQQEIAQSLRLGIDVIKALDHDDFDKLSAPIFVRGYIRSYSALVGISADDVVGVYNEQVRVLTPAKPEEPQINLPRKQKNSSSKTWMLMLLAVIVIIAALLWYFNADMSSPTENQAAPISDTHMSDASPALSLPVESHAGMQENMQATLQSQPPPDSGTSLSENNTVAQEATPEVSQDSMPEQSQIAAEATSEKPDQPVPPAVMPANSQAPATTMVTEQQAAADIDTLDILFPDKSWVEITDASGNKLVYGMVAKGQNIKVSGKPPFRILLGNATGVRIEFNGEPYDFSAHMRGNVARFQLK